MSKHYTQEFKETIVELYYNGKSGAEITREYDISRATIYKWANNAKEISVDHQSVTALEVKQFQARIRQLETENDILKKAMTIFAKR
ncbi:transposase [Thermoactinomyces sp. DSM 45892]|uniref:transposase n=1 Tax=Thermoactinomyces sp. DSM 45892 TaxID=1882753 RepID=UPI00089518EF|nr:transposase [Thermoactinomyces sp. DSM 45892]SDY12840.1 transposase [Thermoactinomyces sp. DSM 45892]